MIGWKNIYMSHANVLLFAFVILPSHLVNAIQTINLNDVFSDDFAVDVTHEIDGWSSADITESANNLPRYHGFWDGNGWSELSRSFNIAAYGTLRIEFTYVYGCTPEPQDYATLTYGSTLSPQWSVDDDTYTIDDTAVTDYCPSGSQSQALGKDLVFIASVPPTEQYLIKIQTKMNGASDQAMGEVADSHWGVTKFSLTLQPLCDFTAFDVDSQILTEYLEQVTDDACRAQIQSQIDAMSGASSMDSSTTTTISPDQIDELEQKYGIVLATNIINDQIPTSEEDTAPDSSYFGDLPLSPAELSNANVPEFSEEDIAAIRDIYDEELDTVLSSYMPDMTATELIEFCPRLSGVYGNIADFQRRLLVGIDPSVHPNYNRVIEADNFCSFTARIASDASTETEYTISIQNAEITIPAETITAGRTEWRETNSDWDSVDVLVLCVDNILTDDCNGYISTSSDSTQANEAVGVYGDFSLDINIYADVADSFSFTVPNTASSGDNVACGWMEYPGQSWQYDGCETQRTETGDIVCKCTHQTVFCLIEDMRISSGEVNRAQELQDGNIYLIFLIFYAGLAFAATYLVLTLFRIKDTKKLAFVIIAVLALQTYCHVIQYGYLSLVALDSIPLGVTFCIISLPLLCHFWVCSLLILHWMKIFECAQTFNSTNKMLDYGILGMNIAISVIFITLLIAAMLVPRDSLSSIVSASNGVLGIVGILICIAWFYFGYTTSQILKLSAQNIGESCVNALDETLTLRKRLLRLTFIIGSCFFIQSLIAILSIIDHLQLFSKHFVNFTTIWALCDIVIMLTFILFYKTHVSRQKKIYQIDQREREKEMQAKRKQRDGSSSQKPSTGATPDESHGIFRRLTEVNLPRLSVFANRKSITSRRNTTSVLDTKSSSELPAGSKLRHPTISRDDLELSKASNTNTPNAGREHQDNFHLHLPVMTALPCSNSEGSPTHDSECPDAFDSPSMGTVADIMSPPPFAQPVSNQSRISVATDSTCTMTSLSPRRHSVARQRGHCRQFSQDDSVVNTHSATCKPRSRRKASDQLKDRRTSHHCNNKACAGNQLTLDNLQKHDERGRTRSVGADSRKPKRSASARRGQYEQTSTAPNTPSTPSAEKVEYGTRKMVKAKANYTPKMTSNKKTKKRAASPNFAERERKKKQQKKVKARSKDDQDAKMSPKKATKRSNDNKKKSQGKSSTAKAVKTSGAKSKGAASRKGEKEKKKESKKGRDEKAVDVEIEKALHEVQNSNSLNSLRDIIVAKSGQKTRGTAKSPKKNEKAKTKAVRKKMDSNKKKPARSVSTSNSSSPSSKTASPKSKSKASKQGAAHNKAANAHSPSNSSKKHESKSKNEHTNSKKRHKKN